MALNTRLAKICGAQLRGKLNYSTPHLFTPTDREVRMEVRRLSGLPPTREELKLIVKDSVRHYRTLREKKLDSVKYRNKQRKYSK